MDDLNAPNEFEKFKEHLGIGDQLHGLGLSVAYYKKLQELNLIERELLQLAMKGLQISKGKKVI